VLAFHVTKGGYPGGYPGGSIGGYPGYVGGYPGGYSGGYPYDNTGIIGTVYPGTSYRGSSLIPGYRGYQYIGPGGLVGGGQIG